MKKTTIVCIFIQFILISQITAQLSLYGLNNNQGFESSVYTTGYTGVIPSFDSGTNVYKKADSQLPFPTTNYILRENNYWYLGRDGAPGYYSGANVKYFKTINQHFDNDPPCTAFWTAIDGTGSPIGPQIILYITGSTCVQPQSNFNSFLSPEFVRVPSLSSQEIANIVDLDEANITFDKVDKKLKYFNGFEWDNIMSSRGNDVIERNLTIKDTLKLEETNIIKFENPNFPNQKPSITSTSGGMVYSSGTPATNDRGIHINRDGSTSIGYLCPGCPGDQTSALNINGSLSVTRISLEGPGSSFTIDDTPGIQGNLIYYINKSTPFTINLPADPNLVKYRVLIFTNHGTSTVTFNSPIRTGSSSSTTTLAPGSNMMIQAFQNYATGGYWVKIL